MDAAAAPLPTLLSWTLVAFTMEFDSEWERALGRAAARPSIPVSMVMWSNYMRAVEDDGVTLDALGDRTRVPVKSLRATTGGLERWGYVTVDGAGSGRDGFGSGRGIRATSVIGPTAAGTAMRAIWRPLTGTIEARWSERFGSRRDRPAPARACVGIRARRLRLAPLRPDHRSDERFRHRAARRRAVRTTRRPISRRRCRAALLSYTAEFERESEASLPVFANTLRVLADEGIRQRDLPAAAGISKEAVAMMVSHLVREGLATAAPGTKVVELTQRGQAVHESCRARRDATAAGTDTELRDALVAVLSRREQLAAGLQPPQTGWRMQKPYVTQTNAILADPIAALPHHPMVLHRGGWPDGA